MAKINRKWSGSYSCILGGQSFLTNQLFWEENLMWLSFCGFSQTTDVEDTFLRNVDFKSACNLVDREIAIRPNTYIFSQVPNWSDPLFEESLQLAIIGVFDMESFQMSMCCQTLFFPLEQLF